MEDIEEWWGEIGNDSGYGSYFDYEDAIGYGYGSGSGEGDGTGDGSGNGYGSGFKDDTGYGAGDGNKIYSINNQKIHSIDNIPTIITKKRGNIAKGYILRIDFELKPTYVAKNDKYFAHGKTIHEAVEALREKTYENLDEDEAIEKFIDEVDITKKHKASEFYKWHHILTGSCQQGRQEFMRNHNISDNDEFTVQEFIEITKNSYGGETIKKLGRRINDD